MFQLAALRVLPSFTENQKPKDIGTVHLKLNVCFPLNMMYKALKVKLEIYP